jgi:hypothetical protein
MIGRASSASVSDAEPSGVMRIRSSSWGASGSVGRWCACWMEGEMPPAPARHVIARGRRTDLAACRT